jgi:hypothetical protein
MTKDAEAVPVAEGAVVEAEEVEAEEAAVVDSVVEEVTVTVASALNAVRVEVVVALDGQVGAEEADPARNKPQMSTTKPTSPAWENKEDVPALSGKTNVFF